MRNNRGFTLIEIIVGLLITIAVLTSALAIAINVTDVFNNSSDSNIDKTALDSISEYVRNQVEYSTDVAVGTTKPSGDNWHTLSIVNGMLQRDGKDVYNQGFYNNKTLSISMKIYLKTKSRLDLTYKLTGTSDNYSTNDTLKLLNLDSTSSNLPSDSDSINIVTKGTSNDINLYYKIDDSVSINNSTNTSSNLTTGTVADKIEFLNNYTNRGIYTYTNTYYKGDFVRYKGYWWLALRDIVNSHTPGTEVAEWERIDATLFLTTSTTTLRSGYRAGDVVIYGGIYFKFLNDEDWYSTTWPLSANYWSSVSSETAKATTYTNTSTVTLKTVRNKLDGINETDIPTYSSSKSYSVVTNPTKATDFVKIYDSTNGLYIYYLKVANGDGTAPGTSASSGWQILTRDYNSKSAYLFGDCVMVTNLNFGSVYMVAQKTITQEYNPQNYLYTDSTLSTYAWKLYN